jgi:hypothetical protein
MPEKISDIYYPRKNSFQLSKGREIKKVYQKPSKTLSKRKISFWQRFLLFGGLVILIIFFLSNYLFSQAEIEVWPITETLTASERIEIKTKIKEPDLEKKIVPGKEIEINFEKSQDFPATGKTSQGSRAKGVIRVYNTASTQDQVLIANTRFISAEGKLFRSLKRVVIPGGKYDEKGKLIPGFLDVEVIAAEPGEEYNISPSTFAIPGFAGTPKYTSFYGQSFAPMSGGSSGEAPQVKEEDLKKAQEQLLKNFSEEGKRVLENQLPSDFVLLEDALLTDKVEFSSNAQPGDNVNSFEVKIKGIVKGLAFKKSDTDKLARKIILDKKPTQEVFSAENSLFEKRIDQESFKIDYKPYSIDWARGLMILEMIASAKIYPALDDSILKKFSAGKSLEEAKTILKRQGQIKKVEIKLTPFWVKKIPQKLEKIKIKLNID